MQCPQCGAPVVLDETEYIIQCGFCRTRNIIHTHPYPCYYMTPRQEKHAGLPVIYVPYWRFKGLEFSLGIKKPGFRVIDHSYLASDLNGFPVSLGLRSQTQTLRFVPKDIPGSFLPSAISNKEILKAIAGEGDKKIHIGEILSLIYMPFYQGPDTLYDGLSGKALEMNPFDIDTDKNRPVNHIEFTPGLCPNCGWDLEGETDSLVLHCRNCTTAWLIYHKRLHKFKSTLYGAAADTDMQMPFWRLKIEFQTLDCSTYAHLIKIANIPKVILDVHEKQPLYFYIPAFKISPKLFLRIGKQTTLAQIEPAEGADLPKTSFHPVDLALEEAFQAVPPVLMDLCTNKKEIWHLLSREKLKLKSFSLVYVSFRASGSEYIQDTLGFSLQINSLKFGRRL